MCTSDVLERTLVTRAVWVLVLSKLVGGAVGVVSFVVLSGIFPWCTESMAMTTLEACFNELASIVVGLALVIGSVGVF